MQKLFKKLLAVIAHPDDESFGFGGTLAKYAREGVEVHVLCATRGEEGQTMLARNKLGKAREQELLTASKILGVAKVEFMDYRDGTLCNGLYHEIAAKIEAKIKSFKPQVVVTFDQNGISGHIDHITIALTTTYVCQKYTEQLKLYYFGRPEEYTRNMQDYFIYFPPGFKKSEIDVVIDISKDYDTRVAAMHAHKTQMHDVARILKAEKDRPREDHFVEVFKKTLRLRSGQGSVKKDLFY